MPLRAEAPSLPTAAPGGAAPRSPLLVPGIVLGVLAAGVAGAFAMGWLGRGAPAAATSTGDVSPPASGAATAGPGSAASGGPASPSPADPLAPLVGTWKSDSGRLYDAVPAGGGVEMRLREASQLAGQGYQDGEARFVLSAIPGEISTFNVEDRVRPLPPERTSYDEARARPTCLVTWTELGGKPLQARLEGDRLTMDLVVFKADKSNFVLERNRVVRCSGLTRALVTGTTSVLTRQ